MLRKSGQGEGHFLQCINGLKIYYYLLIIYKFPPSIQNNNNKLI